MEHIILSKSSKHASIQYFKKVNGIFRKSVLLQAIFTSIVFFLPAILLSMVTSLRLGESFIICAIISLVVFFTLSSKITNLFIFWEKILLYKYFKNHNYWDLEYLKAVIKEPEDFEKQKDELLHQIKIETISKEENVWRKSKDLISKAHEARMILLELGK